MAQLTSPLQVQVFSPLQCFYLYVSVVVSSSTIRVTFLCHSRLSPALCCVKKHSKTKSLLSVLMLCSKVLAGGHCARLRGKFIIPDAVCH